VAGFADEETQIGIRQGGDVRIGGEPANDAGTTPRWYDAGQAPVDDLRDRVQDGVA
jgi:hypothetical protein